MSGRVGQGGADMPELTSQGVVDFVCCPGNTLALISLRSIVSRWALRLAPSRPAHRLVNRCIHPGRVGPPRNSGAIPRRLALPGRRFGPLGASPYFRDSTLEERRS